MTDSFWDISEFSVISEEETPTKILKKQASELSVLTKQVVNANIETSINGSSFLHCFNIIAPVLNYSLTTAFCIDQPLTSEFPLTIYTGIGVLDVNTECKNLDEFKEALKAVFKSEKMVSLIKNIVSQSI